MLQKIKKMDFNIILLLLILMVISILSIYSVTISDQNKANFWVKTCFNYVLGFIAFFTFSFINYKLLIKYAWLIYIFGIGLLILALVAGNEFYGAKGWITLPGGFSLQPAELFKLLLVLFIASLLFRKKGQKLRFWKDIIPLGALVLLPLLIVLAQNDLGNALSYVMIFAGMLWVGNIKYTHALIGLAIAVAAVFGGIQAYIHYHDQVVNFIEKKIGKPHWIARFDPWLVPEKASKNSSWQTDNAKLAIGSGGLAGKGFMKGTTVQSGRVPLAYADSIFVQIAEEYGFIGSSVLLLLYFVLIHRMILAALDCRKRAGPYIITGIIAMFIYQIFVNIGAFIGLMPLTGITLPFISLGGTSLLINMVSVGIVVSIRIYGQDEEDDQMPEIEHSGSGWKRKLRGLLRS